MIHVSTARATALLITLGASVLSAQQTWGGLRFGMSEADAMVVLKGRLKRRAASPEAKGGLYEPFERFRVTVGRGDKPLQGLGRLAFETASKQFQRITMLFEFGDGKANDAAIESRAAAYDVIRQQMLEKYGRPAVIEGRCPTGDQLIESYVHDGAGFANCEMTWSLPSQSVRLSLVVGRSNMLVYTKYERKRATPSDL